MILVLEFLQQQWENMAQQPKFRDMLEAFKNSLENLCKWYCSVNDTDAYFICLGTFFSWLLADL
jgi:hypothetical protein